MKKILALLYILILPFFGQSQIGGENVFEFVDISSSAKASGLGGKNISIKDNDLSIAYKAPSLLDSNFAGNFAITFASHFQSQTDIGQGFMAYAHNYKGYSILAGVNYINYGRFEGYDEYNNSTGTFLGQDMLFTFSAAKPITEKITVGASIKPIYSSLESYTSFALAGDLSTTYCDTASLLTATFLVRNFGYQFKPYTDGNREKMPFGIDIGVTKKLKHAPLRISITYQDLQKFNTHFEKFDDGTSIFEAGEEEHSQTDFEKFGGNLLSHFIIGAELLLFKNLYFSGGYNFKKRRELTTGDRNGSVGLSFGFGLKLYKFKLSYGHEVYHLAGATNVFTLKTDFAEFKRKKIPAENL